MTKSRTSSSVKRSIRPLRILVPSIYVGTLISAAAATALDGIGSGALPCAVAGFAALLVWIAVTLGGTVPINAAVLDCNATAPPAGSGGAQIERWEDLNSVRAWLAAGAFALLLAGLLLS